MALINRMARLFTADMHAVLDRMEEPTVLLRQAVREMEAAVATSERHIAALEQARSSMASRRQQLEAAITELTGQLDVCFASGSDELARKLIRRRLHSERYARHLADRLDAADATLAAARGELASHREQLDHVRQKAALFDDRDDTDSRQHAFDASGDGVTVGDDEVEVAFLREKQRRTQR